MAGSGGTTFTKPKNYVCGFNCRNGGYFDNAPDLLALCESACLDFNLRDLFPTDPATTGGVLVENAAERDRILAQIARARSLRTFRNLPYYLELRPRSGFWDPDWFKDKVGRIPYATDNGWSADMAQYKGAAVDGSPGAFFFNLDCSKFWDAAGIPYRQMMTAKIFELFFSTDPTDVVVALTVAWTSTQFTEVANKQGSIQANVDTLLANGYSLDAEQAMLLASWQDALPRAKQYGVSIGTSWNTYGTIDTSKSPAKFRPVTAEEYTFGLIDLQVATLGVFAQPQNHSFDQTFIGGDRASSAERRLWDKLASVQCQISEQTATLAKMKADGLTVKGAVEALVTMGSIRCELPFGCEQAKAGDGNYIDLAYAKAMSPKLAYRPERDPAPTPDPGTGGTVGSGQWVSDWLVSTTADASLADEKVTLPASIPDGAFLLLMPVAGAGVTVAGVTGGSGDPRSLTARTDSTGATTADDANGANLHTIPWLIPVSSVDGGHDVVAHLSGTARGAVVGRVFYGWEVASTALAFINADNGAGAAATPDPAHPGPTVLLAAARIASGTTAIALPTGSGAGAGAVSSTSAVTSAGTGYNVAVAAVELAPGQTGAGAVSTSPAATKVTSYAIALRQPTIVVDPTDPTDPGGGGTPPPDPGSGGTGSGGTGGTPPPPPPTNPWPPTTARQPIRWGAIRYSGRLLANLPSLEPNGSLRRTMGKVETQVFTLSLDPSRGPLDDWATATLEGATALIGYTGDPKAERIVWGGLVLKRRIDLAGVLQVTAATPEAYLDRRFTGDLVVTGTPAQAIGKLVQRAALGDPRVPGSVGWPFRVVVTDAPGTPTGTWQFADSADKTLLSAISDVAAGSDTMPGAQWMTGWVWERGTGQDGSDLIVPVVYAGSPRIGRTANVTGNPPGGYDVTALSDAAFSSDWGDGKGATIVTATAAAGGTQTRVSGWAAARTSDPRLRPQWETRITGPAMATTAAALAAYAGAVVREIGDGRQAVGVTARRDASPRVIEDWDLADDLQVTVDGFGRPATLTGQVVSYDLTADEVTPYVAVDGGDGSSA